MRGVVRGDVLAKLLDLLDLGGELGGEGLLERLRWALAGIHWGAGVGG